MVERKAFLAKRIHIIYANEENVIIVPNHGDYYENVSLPHLPNKH